MVSTYKISAFNWINSVLSPKKDVVSTEQRDGKEKECFSNTAIIGELQKTFEKDKRTAAIKSNEEFLEEFRTNYASGCTTVLSLAQKSTEYNPFYNSESEFFKYLEAIIKCPFFLLASFEEICLERKEKNWNSMLDEIVNLYDGVMEIDRQKIKNSIINLIKSVCSQKKNFCSQKLFFQSVINVQNNKTSLKVTENETCDRVQVYLYYTVIDLYDTKSKSVESRQSHVTMKRCTLDFNKSTWYENAHLIKKENASFVTDWLADKEMNVKNMPTLTSSILPCFP